MLKKIKRSPEYYVVISHSLFSATTFQHFTRDACFSEFLKDTDVCNFFLSTVPYKCEIQKRTFHS
jgi:hypothetical protein